MMSKLTWLLTLNWTPIVFIYFNSMAVESSQRKLNIFTINFPDSRETVSTIVIQNKGERKVNIIQNVND